jgi:RNA polymerase sigma factor (sigma-70 family)
MAADPDFELLERWRGGDRKAGDQLVTKYYSQVRRFFTNSVADDEFQDLTNDTFKRLMTAKTKLSGLANVRTFLFGIARRVLYDHLRKRYRHQAHGFDPMTHSVEDVEGATPSRAVAELEQYRRLVECLRALPVDTKLLLELYYWNGCTANELAEIYEIEPGTVRTRIHAARQRLKRWVETGVSPVQATADEPTPAELEADVPDDDLAKDLRAVGKLLTSGPSGL